MITAALLTNGTLTVLFDGNNQQIARNDHPRWTELVEAYKTRNEERLRVLFSMQAVVEEYTTGVLSVNATGVTYAGKPVHTVDAERVMAFLRDGLPYKPIANYIRRKMANPSARSIEEMYNFLEHRGMPLTDEGTFIAYKGVQLDFFSVRGNKETVVIQGTVNEEGQILNTIGATIEVQRNCVSDDFRNACGPGLHAGSLDYARGWGQRVVLVEIDPADVVSVPEDSSCQKLRCCKYKVIGDYTGPMPDTYTNEFSSSEEDDVCHTCGSEEGNCGCDDLCDGGCGEAPEDCTCDNPCSCGESECPECTNGLTNETQSEAEANAPLPCGCDKTDYRECQHDETTTPMPGTCCQGNSECEALGHAEGSAAPFVQPPPAFVAAPVLSNTYKRLVDLVSDQFGLLLANIHPEDTFKSLGADSLDGVEMSMAIEEVFGFEIPDEDAEKGYDLPLSEIVKYIDNRIANKDTDDAYLNGMKHGASDNYNGNAPLYRAGDQEQSDTPEQSRYIDGYVNGFKN